MRHYVQYHNSKCLRPPSAEAGHVVTNKSITAQDLEGSRIWLIEGRGGGSPKAYFLHTTFLVQEVCDSTEPGFTLQLTGKPDASAHLPRQIPAGPVLDQLMRCTGRFGFGLTEITRHTELTHALQGLAEL